MLMARVRTTTLVARVRTTTLVATVRKATPMQLAHLDQLWLKLRYCPLYRLPRQSSNWPWLSGLWATPTTV